MRTKMDHKVACQWIEMVELTRDPTAVYLIVIALDERHINVYRHALYGPKHCAIIAITACTEQRGGKS